MRNRLYLAAALQVIFSWVLPAQSSILFQTTTPPSANQPSARSISPAQFVGNYFVLNSPAHIDSVAAGSSVLTNNDTIFAAILPVANSTTLPAGTLGTGGTLTPSATAILHPTTNNAVVSASVFALGSANPGVDLPAGTYVLVFGTGQYGATSDQANLMFSDGTPVSVNQLNYGAAASCPNAPGACWYPTTGVATPLYFSVTGTGTTGLASLSSLSPNFVAPGNQTFNLQINGSGFKATSTVAWTFGSTTTPLTPGTITATQITVSIPANLVATAGSANVVVVTDGNNSNALPFTIGASGGPQISSISPSGVLPGSSAFNLTVNGSGFVFGAQIQWNNANLITNFTNSSTLTAQVNPTFVQSGGIASINVKNPDNSLSNTVPFTIGTVSNAPTITGLSPSTAAAGGAAFALTVNGSNFASNSVVFWGSTQLASPTFVNAGQLVAQVPANLIASAGPVSVSVSTPSVGTSSAFTFQVTSGSGGLAPSISGLSPQTAVAGSPATALTVNGQGFLSGATVLWNNQAVLSSVTLVSATQMTAIIPATLLATPGSASVTVSNSSIAISNPLTFTITPAQTSTTILQTTLPPTPGQPGTNLLSATNFAGNAFQLTSRYHIDSISTYAQSARGGTIFGAIVSIPSLGSSPTGNPFDGTTKISAILTLTPSVSSNVVTATTNVDLDPGFYVIVFGSGGYYNSNATDAFLATSNGASSSLPAGWNQVIWSPNCGGNPCWTANYGTSSPFYFAISGSPSTSSPLSITTLDPSSAVVGRGDLALTINGSGFDSGSTIQWNGSSAGLTPTFVSALKMTTNVPASFFLSSGSFPVTVTNSLGTKSNAVSFTVGVVTPVIQSLNPSGAVAGQASTLPLTVNGSGFGTHSIVQLDGLSLTTAFVNSNQLTTVLPANLVAHTAGVTVFDPDTGRSSPTFTFVISISVPVITSINPSALTLNSPDSTITITGTGFVPGSVVLWGNTQLSTTYASGTQVSATVPRTLLTSVGSFTVTVRNPDGTTSIGTPFPVSGTASGGLAHYAVGSNFTTGITVINTGASSAIYSIAFFDDNGNAALLPFSTGTTNRLSGTLAPYSSAYFEAGNPNLPLTSGWAQISADSAIVIQGLFRSTLNNTHYEASVDSSSGSKAFELPFDATNFAANTPTYTGIAIANLDSVNTANVTCIARDLSGNTIPNGIAVPPLRALGHWAGFQFPALTGYRGTLDCVSTTNVVVIGLRFIGTDTFSSLPVIKK